MLQQAQKEEKKELSSCNVDEHIVITINDDENEWKMKQKANSKSTKTTKIIKRAIILFVVGVALLATSFYVSDNYTSRKLQTKRVNGDWTRLSSNAFTRGQFHYVDSHGASKSIQVDAETVVQKSEDDDQTFTVSNAGVPVPYRVSNQTIRDGFVDAIKERVRQLNSV